MDLSSCAAGTASSCGSSKTQDIRSWLMSCEPDKRALNRWRGVQMARWTAVERRSAPIRKLIISYTPCVMPSSGANASLSCHGLYSRDAVGKLIIACRNKTAQLRSNLSGSAARLSLWLPEPVFIDEMPIRETKNPLAERSVGRRRASLCWPRPKRDRSHACATGTATPAAARWSSKRNWRTETGRLARDCCSEAFYGSSSSRRGAPQAHAGTQFQ